MKPGSLERADVCLTTEPSWHPLNTVVMTLKLQANTDLRASCRLGTPASTTASSAGCSFWCLISKPRLLRGCYHICGIFLRRSSRWDGAVHLSYKLGISKQMLHACLASSKFSIYVTWYQFLQTKCHQSREESRASLCYVMKAGIESNLIWKREKNRVLSNFHSR